MKKIVFALIALAATSTQAATTVPFVFASGDTAKASDVNADFQALATAIDNLASRVGKLEGQFTTADLNGAVYAMHRMSISFGNNPITNHDSYTGTVTLSADGSISMAQTDRYYNNSAPQGSPTVNRTVTTATYGGTWTLANQVITGVFTVGRTITFTCVSGGRLCVSSITNDSDGTVELGILLRTN